MLVASLAASAHQDLELQIRQLDRRIADTPNDLALLLRRADLYRRHRDWAPALRDYERAAQIDPAHANVALGRARTLLDQGDAEQGDAERALGWISALLKNHPGHAEARLIQARALLALGRNDEAASAFESAIRRLAGPNPDHYLEYAQALIALDPVQARQRALEVLGRGAERLADPISLHARAFELETAGGDFEAALKRTRQILERHPRLLNWKLTEARLLVQLGQAEDARRALLSILSQVEALPPQRRASRAIQAIVERSRAYLSSVGIPEHLGMP